MRTVIQLFAASLLLAGLLSSQTPVRPAPAQAPDINKINDPLLRLLAAKGLVSADELLQIANADPATQRNRLAQVLYRKGILSEAELKEISTDTSARSGLDSASPGWVAPVEEPIAPPPTPALPIPTPGPPPVERAVVAVVKPPVPVPAVAPLRVLQVDPIKKDGMVPDIKLGSGARLKLYGFVKASAIYDSSSPSGTDMPLPYLNGDTGPDVNSEFHVRARNMRLGTQFEWPDIAPKTVLTGKFETDFEGSFTRSLNRNISTVRSSQLSLRTAWARIDHNFSDRNTYFLLVGQDWTPFGSSTIPSLMETTGMGLGYGTLYERLPQIRTGWIHTVGGSRSLKFLPEFAVTLPAFGNTPSNVADQLGYGERQGADSGRPEIQGRFVTEWQFDKAPGVVPAQFVVSFVQAGRKALVKAADVPAAFKAAFPSGAEVSSGRYGYTIELQLPTRAATFTGKYYHGEDLRFYFVGGLYSNFNDPAGLTAQASAPSIDGASTVIFGMRNGVPVIAPERPVRTQGYSLDLGLPFSRWAGAAPGTRAAGWSANLHYSIDMVPARDARRMSGVRGKSDLAAFTLTYKLNSLVSLMGEESMYRTRAANSSATDFGGLFLLRGIPARQWHDIRTEIGPVFTF
jgi:hypothetical protein